MASDRDVLREWHRLFGLILTDFFTDSPFTVEVERDLSQQQQFLDVVIVRRGHGRLTERLPDGLTDLVDHNLITFKSHHETLDDWAMKELIGHYVAYRKLVSRSPSELLSEDKFKLYTVCARFPQRLSGQAPWHERKTGVYDCQWGTDRVKVIVAGQLPREEQNAPLHLFSASPELVGFGQGMYRRHSDRTSGLIGQLFERFHGEGLLMAYTMADFTRDFILEHFPKLSLEEQRKILQSVPPEERLADLTPEQIRQLVDRLTEGRPAKSRKPRRKK